MAYNQEATKQFKEIYEKHHDPKEKQKRKFEENKKKRREQKQKDTGL